MVSVPFLRHNQRLSQGRGNINNLTGNVHKQKSARILRIDREQPRLTELATEKGGKLLNENSKNHFFAALIFAHLALAAAEIFFLAAALIVRLPLVGCTPDTLPLAFAHLAFWAAAILARAALLILRFFRGAF
jgi:hypothetical protein